MALIKSIQQTLVLAVVLVTLLSYQFMSAQTWSAPTATAPSGNATAPLNIGGTYQAKLGDLGAVRMRAGEYCDAAGLNCYTAASTQGSGIGVDQQWYDMRSSREIGTSYQNDTTKPILVSFQRGYVDGLNSIQVSRDNSTWVNAATCWRGNSCTGVIVPVGQWYRITGPNHVGVWSELRDQINFNWVGSTWTRVGTTYNYTRTLQCNALDGSVVADSNCPTPTPTNTCTGNIFTGSSGCPL